jgi:hypothetical protein
LKSGRRFLRPSYSPVDEADTAQAWDYLARVATP